MCACLTGFVNVDNFTCRKGGINKLIIVIIIIIIIIIMMMTTIINK